MKVVGFKDNPYAFSKNDEQDVTSGVLSLDLKDENDEFMIYKGIEETFDIIIKNDIEKVCNYPSVAHRNIAYKIVLHLLLHCIGIFLQLFGGFVENYHGLYNAFLRTTRT